VYLILKEFLPSGSKFVNFQRKGRGCTALHLAVYEDKEDIETLLLANGARYDIQCTEKGFTETTQQLKNKKERMRRAQAQSRETTPAFGSGR
jgi:hypothetical protein